MIAAGERLADLAPVGWRELQGLLRSVPGSERLPVAASAQTCGAMLSLSFPHWANELLGNPLPRPLAVRLQQTQGYVLSLGQAYDVLIDGEEPPEQAAQHVLPLAVEVHARFAEHFPSGHPFWNHYLALSREQGESARWEALARQQPERRLTPAMVYKLGRKGALLRWPAFAVSALAGCPERGAFVNLQLSRILSVLQLFDDSFDYAKDRASGQPNAVLAALGTPPQDEWALHAGAIEALDAVRKAAQGLVTALRADATGKLGPLLALLERRCTHVAQAAQREAGVRAAQGMLGQLLG